MSNHKWNKDNVCLRCGVKRKMQAWKLLMAITNEPPYDHYLRGSSYVFFSNTLKPTRERPDCEPKK